MYGNCKDCLMWRDIQARIPANTVGPNYCVRNAPVYTGEHVHGGFPMTESNAGCGDFDPHNRLRDKYGNLI
jgi:hypothetical protein